MPRCPECGKLCRLSEDRCSQCSSSLSGAGSIENRLADLDSRLSARLARLGLADAVEPEFEPEPEPDGAESETMSLSPELQQFVFSGPHEPRQAYGLVVESSYTNSNRIYAQRAQASTMHVDVGDFEVNAFATDAEVLTGEGTLLQPPVIVLKRGLLHGICTAAAGMALGHTTQCHEQISAVFAATGQLILKGKGDLGVEPVVAIHQQLILPVGNALPQGEMAHVMAMAQSVRLSAYLYVFSHELGHIALAHTLGRRPNMESSRNQEREADSFASSVLSTCAYREYHFLGQMAAIAMFVWFDEACGSPDATTHPDSRERFANAFVSNSQAAREAEEHFGLSRGDFECWLPE